MKNILSLHGHMCAGVAIGIRVSQAALREMGENTSQNELVAMVETDKCPVDAVQMLMGTTAGRQNLIYEKKGKNVFTFVRRKDGKGIKIIVKESKPDPEFTALREKKFAGQASKAELEMFDKMMNKRIQQILAAPESELLTIEPISVNTATIQRQ
jgi:formylmethanofuran dehydrogenase subunit E